MNIPSQIDADKQRDQVGALLLDSIRHLKSATGTTPERIQNCENFEAAILKVRNQDWAGLGALAASHHPKPKTAVHKKTNV